MAMPVASPDLERWLPEARSLPSGKPTHTVPFNVLLDEADEAADFVKTYWTASTESGAPRRGLESVAGRGVGKRLHATFDDELRSLRRAASAAGQNFTLVSKVDESPARRGLFLLREVRNALESFVDDGETDEMDAHVAALARDHEIDPASLPDLAAALDAYAAVAGGHRRDLDGFGGFESALIDEAVEIADELRRRPATPLAHTPESLEALEIRNRVASLLVLRLRAVRAAAAFVFRDRPDIVRKVTSAYERRKRAAARRAEAKAKAAE